MSLFGARCCHRCIFVDHQKENSCRRCPVEGLWEQNQSKTKIQSKSNHFENSHQNSNWQLQTNTSISQEQAAPFSESLNSKNQLAFIRANSKMLQFKTTDINPFCRRPSHIKKRHCTANRLLDLIFFTETV